MRPRLEDYKAWWEAEVENRERLRARVGALTEALIRCAELSGEDGEAVEAARTGAMKHPTVEAWAVQCVEQLRRDYDNSLDDLAVVPVEKQPPDELWVPDPDHPVF